MSIPFGPDSAHLVALDRVLTELEAAERRIRAGEAERTRLLAEAFDLAAAESERTIASAPRGPRAELAYRAVRAELATALHQSERTVERQLELAHALVADYPRTFAAYEDGAISERHAATIVEAGAVIGSAAHPDAVLRRAGYESAVLEVAAAETPGRLRPVARRIAEEYAETSLDERHAEARTRRRVVVVDAEDGMADLLAHLPAAEAHAIHDRLTRMARAIERQEAGDPDAGRPSRMPRDRRLRDEIRADVLADLLLAGTPSDEPSGVSAIRPHVQLTVDEGLLLDSAPPEPPGELGEPTSPAPAAIAGRCPIDSRTARRLAGGASGWDAVRSHPETGAVLSVDRYRPSEAMRRALGARDEHCRFPGCRMPLSRCDIDHTVDAARGGPTTTSNLAHLCRGHHMLKHHTGWRVAQDRTGTLEWTSPTGRRHRDRPASRVRFAPVGTAISGSPEGARASGPPGDPFSPF